MRGQTTNMSKPVIAAIAFVVAAAITLGVLQFIIHLNGALTKIVIGAVVGLIVGGIAFVVVKEPAKT
jgi:hypothetical protein